MRNTLTVLGLLWCLLCAGCLEAEQTIVIAADGSGTQSLTLAMTPKVVAAIQRSAPITMQNGDAAPMQILDRDLVEKELRTAGMLLGSFTAESKAGRQRVAMTATFPDLAALQKSPLSGTRGEWAFGPGPQAGTLKLTFYPQGEEAWRKARDQAAKNVDTPDPLADQYLERKRNELAGLDVKFVLRVPGKVLLHTRNLRQSGDNEVTVHTTHRDIVTTEDLLRRLAPRYEVVFDGSGCTMRLDAAATPR